MEFSLSESIAILKRTPVTLNTLLRGLPDHWTHQNEGPETWSPYDVIGHLIHGEKTDWLVRTKIILFEENKQFEPFDRFAQFEESKGFTLEELLDEFEVLRKQNLLELEGFSLSSEDFVKKGIHPEFGEITLENLLAAWVVHDLGHIVQINRAMAKQYKENVGPWPKYLTVLN